MARLPAVRVEDAPTDVAKVYELSKARFGALVEPLAITAHNLEAFRAYVGFELAFAKAQRVDARTKALASLKAAALIGCPFCVDIGSAEAREAGVTEPELRDLASYEKSDRFSARDRAVLDYAVAMTRTPVRVADALFAQLQEHFDAAGLVELTAMIAWESFRSRFNHALGIEAQGFSEGAYCVRPEMPA